MMDCLKVINIITVFHIIQWNARSLLANGQEFKKIITDMDVVPDIICIQESWLRPHLEFVLPGYGSVRCDRIGSQGGGCVTFIKDTLAYRRINVQNEYECVVVDICSPRGNIKLVNFYNPCNKLSMQIFQDIIPSVNRREIWCGDFNAHNNLWGSNHTDKNGELVEELMDERSLVCINDGSGTRVDATRNLVSCLDLRLVSGNLSNSCEWKILNNINTGSDHYMILCTINFELHIQEGYRIERWCFSKAEWEKFRVCCKEYAKTIAMEGDVNTCTSAVSCSIINAASTCIPKSIMKGKRKMVPWWNNECKYAIKERNGAFRVLRKHLSQDNLIDYQRKKAKARKIIKSLKKNAWRQFCSAIGREIDLNDVWSMIKKMTGKRKSVKIPVLVDGEYLAVTNKEKADLLGKKFASIHSGSHLDEEHKQRKEDIIRKCSDVLRKKDSDGSALDMEFTMHELKMALEKSGYTAPGQDQLCYAMFRHLPDEFMEIIKAF